MPVGSRGRTGRATQLGAAARMRQPRPKDVADARARGASDEEAARGSFQTREDSPGELNVEGRERCFCASGRRHYNVGGNKKGADATRGADAAFHSAVRGRCFVLRSAGVVAELAATVTRVVVRSVIMIMGEHATARNLTRCGDQCSRLALVPGSAHHHAGRDGAFDRDGHQQHTDRDKTGNAMHGEKYTSGDGRGD